jgi:hypothetical protein
VFGAEGAGQMKPCVVRKLPRPPTGGAPSNALTAWHSAKKWTGCFKYSRTSTTVSGLAAASVTAQCIDMNWQ